MNHTHTPDNASQKKDAARRQFLADLAATFGSPAGAAVLSYLHAAAATRKPAFIPGDRDPHAAAFRDGRKSIVWELEAALETARQEAGATQPTAIGRRAPRTRARAGE